MTTPIDRPLDESPFSPRVRPSAWRARLAFTLVLGGAAAAVGLLRVRSEPEAAHGSGAEHGTTAAPREVTLSGEEARRIGVTFAPVDTVPLQREVRTVATVGYDETRLVSISVRVDGWVDRLFVNFTGQAVAAGQPLFTLYSPMLVSAQQELLLAAELRRDVAAGTPEAVRNAEQLLESARRRLLYWEVPAEEVRAIEATGQVRKALTFRAPAAGVVLEKQVLEGQRLMAGETAYRLADLRTVWLEGEIYERDLGAVLLGAPVTAEFPALPGRPRTGRITYVYPTLNPQTRTARVRVELSNPGLALKPGMYATFRFAATTAATLSVPRSAVLITGKRNLVFVRAEDGRLAPRDVTIGVATDDRVEILSGLAAGDTVVSSATFLVDAESNLASLLGGMSGMPGMAMPTTPAAPPRNARSPASEPHDGHDDQEG